MFPADPMLTAKPVTVADAGSTAGTVIVPLNETGSPERPRRITPLNDCAKLPALKKVNRPVARRPGIDPVEVTVFDCGGEDVAEIICADTSRMPGFGVPVTPTI